MRALSPLLVCLAAAGCSSAQAERAQPQRHASAPGVRESGLAAIENGYGTKPLKGKVVLHVGDSMMGGDYGGLQKSLRGLYEDDGARYERDIWEAVSIYTFAAQDRFDKLLATYKPDVVLITLGANDVKSVIPDSFSQHIRTIVKKVGKRECWWIGPATWKGDAGIVHVIRDNAAHDDGHPSLPWGAALTNPALWLLWLQYFCISYSWYFYITWLPSWLQQNRGLDFKKSAMLAGMPLFFGGIGCLVGGIILGKLVKSMASPTRARKLMGRVGAVVAGLCLAMVPNIDGALPALLVVSLASFGNDLTMPAAWAAAMNLGGRYAGTVSGSMNMMGNAGGALFPLAFPLIRDYLGIDFVFYVSASAYIISFLAWTFLDSSKPIAE